MSATANLFFSHSTPNAMMSRSYTKHSQLKVIVARPIVETPDVLGGKPRIVGRRIAVEQIVIWRYQFEMSEDEIAREFNLTSQQIRDALEYYAEHRAQIDAAIEADAAFATEMQQRYPSKLVAKLRANRSE